MKRLLIRLVLFIIVLSLPLIWEIEMALQWPIDIHELFEKVGDGGCSIVVEKISESHGARREALRKRYEDTFGFPITIHDQEPMPENAAQRIATGRRIAHYWNEEYEDFIAASLDGGGWVSFGPILEVRYVGFLKRIIVYGPILLLYTLAAWLLIWPIVRQHRELALAAARIADYEWKSRVKERSVPDMRLLARAFNQMAEKTERVVASQRMLLKSVSHELRTPLARLRFGVELFSEKEDRGAREDHIRNLAIDLSEMDDLIDELLTYAKFERKDSPSSPTPLVVSDILQSISGSEQRVQKTHRHVELSDRLIGMSQSVNLDKDAFWRASANLVRNALNHAESIVLLDAWVADDGLHVTVDDDGAGIPTEMRDKVFEPFVKLDDEKRGARKGSGLGLAIVKQAVERQGGEVKISSSSLGGARLEMVWPLT